MTRPPQMLTTTVTLCLLSLASALGLGSYSHEPYLDVAYGPSLPPAPFAGPGGLAAQGPLQEIFQYNELSYDLPLGAQFEGGAYDPSRNVFTGLELTRDRIFLAVPRLYPGVPSTLNFVPRSSAVPNPPLQPYPGWEWQSPNGIGGYGANCSGLVSVYRIRKDRCNRLWVLDSGLTNSLAGFIPVCTPKLIAFDLSTDQPVRTITFPRAALRPSTLLTNLAIDDVEGPARDPRCDRLVFYLSDTAVPGMVVYDSGRDLVRRVTDLSMYPDPDFGTYTINGESFSLMDGVIGMALSPPPNRVLYFQPLATDKVFSVPTSALRDFSAGEGQMLPVSLVGRKSSAGAGLAADRNGVLYFSPVQENALAFYDPASGSQGVIAADNARLQFAAELRVDETDGSLWLLSTRFQKYFLNTVNRNEVNLRVVRVPREVIQGGHRIFARSTSNATNVDL